MHNRSTCINIIQIKLANVIQIYHCLEEFEFFSKTMMKFYGYLGGGGFLSEIMIEKKILTLTLLAKNNILKALYVLKIVSDNMSVKFA